MADAGPGAKFAAVVTSNSADLDGVRALYVGTAGNLTVDDGFGNTSVVFKNVANGTLLPICAKRVRTATTAADIVAIFGNNKIPA